MPIVIRTEFAAFVEFTLGGTPYRLGTTTALRGGNWYTGPGDTQAGLAAVPRLAHPRSDAGVQRANAVQIVISDDPAGSYRALLESTEIDGTLFTVDLVTTVTYSSGSTVEQVRTQRLTAVGKSRTKQRITINLQDLEEDKTRELYPSTLYDAEIWPEIYTEDLGRPLPYAVGVALKLAGALIVTNGGYGPWIYAFAQTHFERLLITNSNTVSDWFEIAGDKRGQFLEGMQFEVIGSGLNDGTYTCAVDSVMSGGNTRITIAQSVSAAGGGGYIDTRPQVLTVYRANRIVDSAEYSVLHLLDPGADVTNGDFATNDLTGWTNGSTGTASANAASGAAVLTNLLFGSAYIYQLVTNTATVGGVYAVSFDVSGPNDAWVAIGPAGTEWLANTRCATGRRHTLYATAINTGFWLQFRVYNNAASSSTTIDNVQVHRMSVVCAVFAAEQRDFDGELYPITADVQGGGSRLVSEEIARMLAVVGMTPDAASFATARDNAITDRMRVDCDYARDRRQRTVAAILQDLLFIARGGLYRNDVGDYAIWQDVAKGSIGTWVEDYADLLDVQSLESPARPRSVALSYYPSPSNPGELQQTITRDVTAGQLGAEPPREVRYLRDHVAADRLLCYLALRKHFNETLRAKLYREEVSVGDMLTLASALVFTGERDWLARAVTFAEVGVDLELIQYDADVYVYTAGKLGRDATTGYGPDYSATPPLAPTALTITGAATVVNTDGVALVWVDVRATPPVVNWSQLYFVIKNSVTNEIFLGIGQDVGGGNYGCRIPGLRPSTLHTLQCYAINAFNVEGLVASTFNATAIGGGAADSSFTTPGYASAPPDVASCTATQGSGKFIRVKWPAVSHPNLAEYVVERKVNAGSFAEFWRGRTTGFSDREVSYGTTYQYRVRARDSFGNFSANYATSGSVTPQGNLSGGSGTASDLLSNTVSPNNRRALATVSGAYNVGGLGAFYQNVSMAHSLGKVPIVVVANGGKDGVLCTVKSVDSTDVVVVVSVYPNKPTGTQSAAGDPHTHQITAPTASGSVSCYLF